MKTKLTLNIDDKIIARAKRVSAKRKVSLSAVVENYLDKYSENILSKRNNSPEPSLLDRIRKYTKNAILLPDDYDYKKVLHDHLDKKHG
ncbi:MAG: DUF6364 family protein [Ginsengibacter sp.]